MLRRNIILLFCSFALTACGTVQPRESSVWLKCDGYPKPESLGTTLGRVLLVTGTMAMAGMPEKPNAYARLRGQAGVGACTEVLASDALKGNWLRHVNILRARAIHHLEADDTAAALSDIHAVPSIAGEHASDPGYAHSLGLAMKLLEGVVQRKAGNDEAAAGLLIEVSEKRPYSAAVQLLVTKYLPSSAYRVADGRGVLDQLVRLEPDALQMRAELSGWDSDGADRALADWRALIAAHTPPVIPAAVGEAIAAKEKEAGKKKSRRKKTQRQKEREARERKQKANRQEKMERRERLLAPAPVSASVMGRAALAAARVGDMAQAYAWLAEGRARRQYATAFGTDKSDIGAIVRALSGMKGPEAAKYMANLRNPTKPVQLDGYEALLEVYAYYHAGDLAAARAALVKGTKIPQTPAALELIELLMEGQDGAIASSLNLSSMRRQMFDRRDALSIRAEDLNKLFSALPVYENPKRANSYSGQWGLGLKSSGFEERKRLSGWLTIEYMGARTTRIGVEEMTVMRAAELAKKAGKPAFLIADRRDYQRFSQTTYAGSPIGPRTPAGFKTEIDVVFVDPADLPAEWQGQGDRILDAEQVWRALAPYYLK